MFFDPPALWHMLIHSEPQTFKLYCNFAAAPYVSYVHYMPHVPYVHYMPYAPYVPYV